MIRNLASQRKILRHCIISFFNLSRIQDLDQRSELTKHQQPLQRTSQIDRKTNVRLKDIAPDRNVVSTVTLQKSFNALKKLSKLNKFAMTWIFPQRIKMHKIFTSCEKPINQILRVSRLPVFYKGIVNLSTINILF